VNPDYYGVVEMTFSFGVVLALAVWQLVSLDKAKKKTRAQAAAKAAAKDAPP
jgi:cytochrome oxidase assembly protein ShyY1